MTQSAAQALAAATFESDGKSYRMLRLPSGATTAAAAVIAGTGEAFSAMVVDSSEVTLIVPAGAADGIRSRLPDVEIADEVLKLITVNVVMEPELTGLVAAVARALAGAGVPLLPFASFSRDHFLVMADHFDVALDALNRLQREI